MLSVVIDTSSLVSYVLTQGKLMSRVVAHWRTGTFRLISSPSTRSELQAVLRRPQIQRLADLPLDELFHGLERFSHHVPGNMKLSGACRDAKDDKFLACAVEGEAHYLVSSDRDLLDMRRFRGVAIVNPGQFLLAVELYPLHEGAIAERFDRDVLTNILENIPLEPGTEARLREAIKLG